MFLVAYASFDFAVLYFFKKRSKSVSFSKMIERNGNKYLFMNFVVNLDFMFNPSNLSLLRKPMKNFILFGISNKCYGKINSMTFNFSHRIV